MKPERICPECGAVLTKPRSPQHHRRLFGLISAAFHHWPESHEFTPESTEHLRAWLLCKANYREAREIPVLLFLLGKRMAKLVWAWRDRPLPQVADPETGEIKTDIRNIWFKRGIITLRSGRFAMGWYCGFQVAVARKPQRQKGKDIGVDWGTSVLAALSSGEMIENPRFGERAVA